MSDPNSIDEESARRDVASMFKSMAARATEQYGDVGELDQHLTKWRNQLAELGVDLSDREQLWAAALLVERVLSQVHLAVQMTCPDWPHVLGHVRNGSSAMALLLNSALETYGSPPAS